MIQKLILTLLAAMIGFSLFMIRDVSNKINSLIQDYPNSTANISPAKSTSSSFEETKMPLIWSKIKDNGIGGNEGG
jgi:predicted PurR-regulated permease PerM